MVLEFLTIICTKSFFYVIDEQVEQESSQKVSIPNTIQTPKETLSDSNSSLPFEKHNQ
jgi:hypothetical protein